jgi:hypothetical protein
MRGGEAHVASEGIFQAFLRHAQELSSPLSPATGITPSSLGSTPAATPEASYTRTALLTASITYSGVLRDVARRAGVSHAAQPGPPGFMATFRL